MNGTEKTETHKGKSFARRLLRAAVALLLVSAGLLAALVLSLPFMITHVPIPGLEFDLSPYLTEKTSALVMNKKATAELDIKRDKIDGFRIKATGRLLDWPYSAKAFVRCGFIRRDAGIGPWLDGRLSLSLDGTDWKLSADFNAQSAEKWDFTAAIPEFTITQDDAVLAQLASRLAMQSVSNLVFTGKFALDAEGECTERRPVPSWRVRGSLKDFDASFDTAAGKSVAAKRLRVRFGADGIADHMDISPLFPRADSIDFAGFTLSNVFASVRATERSYLVTEAGAECCGGDLRLYSLFLDPEKLSAGATIFAENIDAGEVLSRVSGFRGEATGKLHGKLPLYLKDGRRLHVRNAYLYSKPGDTGTVRIADASPILDNLAMAGVAESDRDNLAKALANLDYSVMKVELVRGGRGEASVLPLTIEGTATSGRTTVPVKLNVTFRGDFDQLVNTGLNISRRSK